MFFDLSIPGTVYAFSQLIGAPFQNPGILWFALPLVITLIVVELNLAYAKDKGGDFKQALPNAIVLVFISLDLMRLTFSGEGFFSNLFSGSFFASLIVFLLGVVVFLIDYYHEFPRRKWLGFSAHLPVNVVAYSFMVLVYNKLPFDLNIIVAMVLFTGLFALLFFLITRLDVGEKYEAKSSGKMIWERKEKSINYTSKKHSSYSDDVILDPFKGVEWKKTSESSGAPEGGVVADPFKGAKMIKK